MQQFFFASLLLLVVFETSRSSAAPINETETQSDSFEFSWLRCVEDQLINDEQNRTWKHIVQLDNVNETCIHVNQSTGQGNYNTYLYLVSSSDEPIQIPIITDDCSNELPELQFSLCKDQHQSSSLDDSQSTESSPTFDQQNELDSNGTSVGLVTELSIVSLGPTESSESSEHDD